MIRGRGSSKVIEIGARRGACRPVSQRDLVELEVLRKEAVIAVREYHAKRAEIRAALEWGAAIEPGVRAAALCVRKVLICT